MRYSYPGNVRELENIVERAVVLSKGGTITSADLPLHLRTVESEEKICVRKSGSSLNETLDTMERGIILDALKESGGVQTRAAEKLGISERVLRYKLKKYKIKEQ
jgi:two-component system NtrC family response regulator